MSKLLTAYFSDLPSKGLSDEEQESGQVCIANISPFERKLRIRFAIRQFAFTLIMLGGMIALDLNPLWRLPLFFLFAASIVSWFQARDKT